MCAALGRDEMMAPLRITELGSCGLLPCAPPPMCVFFLGVWGAWGVGGAKRKGIAKALMKAVG